MSCDFCGQLTENVYKHVHLCPRCGLVQSEPRSDRTISTSCEADQGNLRNGKAFRFPKSLPLLAHLDWSQIQSALDIGSNRGSFVKWITEEHPDVAVTGIEPEERMVDYPAIIGKFEDIATSLESFDLVFSSHTLEHSKSADAMMRATAELMPIGSHLLLEVPNVATICDPLVVEEFFIYKHNWHFSTVLMIRYLLDLGFQIEHEASTLFDIRLLLRRTSKAIPYRAFDFAVRMTREWLATYQRNIERNRLALPKVAAELKQLSSGKRVAYWGAGRIFDALVRFGDLDLRSVNMLADGMLSGVVEKVHGIELSRPEDLDAFQPDAIVVLGRTSSAEMFKRAAQYAPVVISFDELLDAALA